MVVRRLVDKGIEPGKISACIEAILNIVFFNPVLNRQKLNNDLQARGWHDLEIDEHTFKLVKLISDIAGTAM